MACTSDGDVTVPSTTFYTNKCIVARILMLWWIQWPGVHVDFMWTVWFGLWRKSTPKPLFLSGCMMRGSFWLRRTFSTSTLSTLVFGFLAMLYSGAKENASYLFFTKLFAFILPLICIIAWTSITLVIDGCNQIMDNSFGCKGMTYQQSLSLQHPSNVILIYLLLGFVTMFCSLVTMFCSLVNRFLWYIIWT